jgi:flagellar assembly protein FliH
MSIDTFATLDFPSLRNRAGDDLQARVHGHAAGYAAGLKSAQAELALRRTELEAQARVAAADARARVDAALTALHTATRALDARLAPAVADAESTLADAAVDIAEAVLGRELAAGADSAESALRRVLGQPEANTIVTVRMNPADLHALHEDIRVAAGVALQADASLAPGDAVAQLPDGYLDARIGAALERARAALGER